MKPLLIALLAASTCLAGPVAAEAYRVQDVQPTLQTPILTEADVDADADDPAIYANSTDPARSLVITAVKNGGMRVYALTGELVQTLGPSREDGRINNVDLVYGFTLANGEKVDLAVGSDRGLDVIRVWRIDATGAEPLVEVTDPAEPRAFPKRPTKDQAGSEDNPLDDQDTIYGLAAWTDRDSGLTWVAGTQRHQPLVGLFTLQALPEGKVGAKFERSVLVPGTHKGQDLFQEAEDEPLKDWSPQFEGSVVDATTGILYAGQEDVGIWKIDIRNAQAAPQLLYETRGSTESSFNAGESVIARDVEGLTIYYGENGVRYLLASSQGQAHGDAVVADAPYDDSFAVFSIGDSLKLEGSFRIAARDGVDAVQESDGADVISTDLPGFENGLFVTQDGYAGDINGLDGETRQTNFKFVDWKTIAESFDPPLAVTPNAADPRR
ncbi:MAG: phytase [Allorhizobium sp.]